MGNNSSLTRALNLLKSKFPPTQSSLLIQKINKPLIPSQLILYKRVTALVPIMPPNRGRAAKTAAANSIAGKSKQEKNEESDVDGDEEMAVDVKKQSARGKKKENGHDEKPKARGRKKADQEEEATEDVPKASGRGKKKGKEEGQEEPELRKSGRAKKKEAPKEEAIEEDEPPKKVARGRKKAEAVENGDEPEEPSKPTKGRKKAEEAAKPEKVAKRGRKGKAEAEEEAEAAPAVENGVEEANEKEEKAEKLPPKRGRKPAKEAQDPDEDADEEEEKEEKPPQKRGRKAKEAKPEESKQEEKSKPKANAKGKRANDEETEPPPTKKKETKPEEKKPANKAETNLDEIDFTCDKPNAKGDKHNIKICSWNVAGIRAMQNKQGIEYILKEDADVVVLQETKCDADKIPKAWELPGYKRFYVESSKSGYAGVALYSKKEPIDVKYGLEEEFDHEGRLITVEFDGFYVLNVYVPNTGRGLVNMEKRMEWNEAFKKYLKELDDKKPVILCGDMNVAHQEIDLANPKTNTKNAGFTKEERDGMTEFLGTGFVDTFRQLYPDKTGAYTFWSNMRDSRSKNVGWRLDYFIVSERIKDNICDNVMRSNVYGSDHCPIVLYANF